MMSKKKGIPPGEIREVIRQIPDKHVGILLH